MLRRKLKTLLLLGILGLNYLMNHMSLDIQWTELTQTNFKFHFLDQEVSLSFEDFHQNDTVQLPKQNQNFAKQIMLWTLDHLETKIQDLE